MANTQRLSREVNRRFLRVAVAAALVLAAVLFIPAGTLKYWEAWVYMAVLLIPMAFAVRYLLRRSPELLERRLQVRERETAQKRVIGAGWILFLAMFILPGLDFRFGWSSVPVPVVLAADLIVLLGYGLIIRVFAENQYAARTVQVEEEQRVIKTGPYAIVRHPMYVGTLMMYLVTPLALGSYWALIPAAFIIPMLVVRIRNEEQVLERDLAGYREYKLETKYRVVPGVW
jgi:protein-S-isoprenylcysteine O-methyltransferase Ste14